MVKENVHSSGSKWIPLSEAADLEVDIPDEVIRQMVDDLYIKLNADETIGPLLRKAVFSGRSSHAR